MKNSKLQETQLTGFRQEAKKRLEAGDPLLGKEGIFTPLLKEIIESSLSAEMDDHLAETEDKNRRNGRGTKRVRTSIGEIEISTPRDRKGTFRPKLVAKRQKTLGSEFDKLVLMLYSKGNSYTDISNYLAELYGLEVSPPTLSRVTDKVVPLLQAWQSRELEAVYPFVWLDAIHYKVREEGRVITKAVYCVIGVNQEGHKELLGLYMGNGGEGSKFWLQVLTDLQNRGVSDIFVACIDNLNGFAEAIESIFPQTEVQLCIVHQIRNSKKYIAWKDVRAFMRDLKRVYSASTLERAEMELDKLDTNWGKKYPVVINSWRRNWERLTQYFKYAQPIRKIIYTTNVIEGFHRQLRKVTKTKGSFCSDDALMKLLYLVQDEITEKWKRPLHNWNITLAQLSIIFGDRLRLDL
jgi:transposase-like protein